MLSAAEMGWKRQHSSYLLVMDQNNEQLTFLGKSTGGHVSMRDNRETPNKCNLCDFALYEVGQLRTHLKIHSGEKPHKCNQCDNASAKAVHLRRHLNTHKLEKCQINAISVNTNEHRVVPSIYTCGHIQERSLSLACRVSSPAQKLVTSNNTC